MMQGYPDHEAGKTDQEVQETSKKLILFHLLGNLKASYIARERFIQALNIMDKMLFLDRGSVEIYRDRGIIHFLLRDLRMALADLREYVKRAPNARDVRMIQLQVSSLEHIMFDLN
jgi:regulator of sirC expression with transglutaminase-like and TPR domain